MSPQAVLRRTALDNVATLGRRAGRAWTRRDAAAAVRLLRLRARWAAKLEGQS